MDPELDFVDNILGFDSIVYTISMYSGPHYSTHCILYSVLNHTNQ